MRFPAWVESVRTAADLALLGFLLSLAALPLLTAGAAVGTASEAVRHFQRYDSWPGFSTLSSSFRRRLVPGLWAGPVLAGGLVLAGLDVAGLRRGVVPGGPPMVTAVLVVAVLSLGWAALVAVLGGRPLFALGLASARPALLLAASGVVLVAALLGLFVHPVLVPALAGFALYALHAVTARLAPATISA
jgi:hypothetical protein